MLMQYNHSSFDFYHIIATYICLSHVTASVTFMYMVTIFYMERSLLALQGVGIKYNKFLSL